MFKKSDFSQEQFDLNFKHALDEHFESVKRYLPKALVDVVTARETGHFSRAEAILTRVDATLITLNETLNRHLQVATLRFGLEKSDRGAFDSLKRGLNHMYKRSSGKEHEGLRRKIKSILLEFEILERKALIDDIINELNLSTEIQSTTEQKSFIVER
jgi:hypothetical protein